MEEIRHWLQRFKCEPNLEFIFQYLYNLDPNSAYYDPKTRSMRENPFKESEGTQNK